MQASARSRAWCQKPPTGAPWEAAAKSFQLGLSRRQSEQAKTWEDQMQIKFAAGVLALAVSVTAAQAEDTIKLAIGQRGNWDTSISEIGQRVGIFKKHGLVLEMVYT